MSRYIDLFIRSDETHEVLAERLQAALQRRLQRVTDRGADVLYLYSGRYKWFDVCAGMLDRHPTYGYQLYVGRGHHDIGDRLRINFAWSIFEKLSALYPLIFEDNLSGVSLHAEPGSPPPVGVLNSLVQAGAGEVATIFAASRQSPSTFCHALGRLLHMEAHTSTRAHSPVIAVLVGEAVRMRVEVHDYEDTDGLSLKPYRYVIDLDPLDAPQVYARLKTSGRYGLLWLRNLAEVVDSFEPAPSVE
ncbi:MAG: hypothetical protein SF162_20785 [bacterium]|nr:hypothetical protein [bacterium]